MQRQRERNGVILTGLRKPTNFAAEHQPGEKYRMAEPEDGTKHDRKYRFDGKINHEQSGAANARRSSGDNKTSMAVASFGENHMSSTHTNSAMPASARINEALVSENATASVPRTSSPIQAGELMNIRIANANW